MNRRERLSVVGVQLTLAVLVLAIWVYETRAGHVSPILLPKPEQVAQELWTLLGSSAFWAATGRTLIEVGGAFALATGAGLLVGVLLGRWAPAARIATPLFAWAQTVPIILFYPICILFFGLGTVSKIAFGGFYGFFPIVANSILALTTVPPRYLTAAAALGANRRQVVGRVLLPAARPLILSGVRLGAALCLIGVLAGEILGSTAGLGYEIAASAGAFETPQMYAYIVAALVLVALFNLAITRADERQAQV